MNIDSPLSDNENVVQSKEKEWFPLQEIEDDMRTLMGKIGTLTQENRRLKDQSLESTRRLLLDLFVVADALELLIQDIEDDSDSAERCTWMENRVSTIKIRLDQAFSLNEVSPIPVTPGEVLDPNFHQAVETVRNEEIANDVVVGQVSTGYMFRDWPVRYAGVCVVNNQDEKE